MHGYINIVLNMILNYVSLVYMGVYTYIGVYVHIYIYVHCTYTL